MSSVSLLRRTIKINQLCRTAPRLFSSDVPPAEETSKPNANVSGLSSKVLDVPKGEIGPGASKSSNYKNPEYFSYHKTSYFDAELEMANFRIPQPSSK